MNKQDIFIPFTGFYESIHNSQFDFEVEGEIEHLIEQGHSTEQAEKWRDSIKWKEVHIDYAKKYVENFQNWINEAMKDNNISDMQFTFEFKELISPREYNFTTDRILCTIETNQLKAMRDSISPMGLNDAIAEKFTSRSGFISFYANNLEAWNRKALPDWDANQCEVILEVLMDEILTLNINDDSGLCMFPHSENHELVSEIIGSHCEWPVSWVAMVNMPGFMPDSEPSVYDTWEGARDGIRAQLKLTIDDESCDDETIAQYEKLSEDFLNAESGKECGGIAGNWFFGINKL